MNYEIIFAPEAELGLSRLYKNEPKAYQKALKLIAELHVHPRSGTGKPKQLSGNRAEQWSRRITEKHRLIYEIHDTEIVVLVLSSYGHYNDK